MIHSTFINETKLGYFISGFRKIQRGDIVGHRPFVGGTPMGVCGIQQIQPLSAPSTLRKVISTGQGVQPGYEMVLCLPCLTSLPI